MFYSYTYNPMRSGLRVVRRPRVNSKQGLCCCGGPCCNGTLGEARGVTNPNAQGERAQAVVRFVNNTRERTAGGTYLGTNVLVETVQELGKLPQNYLQYMTVPGITYTVAKGVWSLGKSSANEIATTINNNPNIKENVKNFTKKVVDYGKDIIETVYNPVKGVSQTIAWLPYIVIGGLLLLAVFVFKNPETVKPGKVSVF